MAGEPVEGAGNEKEEVTAVPAVPAVPAATTEATETTETTETTSAETGEVVGEDAKPAGDEEDTGAQIAPIVRLEEVVISTGEENEEVLLDLKSKLYRFDKDGSQWKERGVGQVKLLQHKENKKIRLLMRQSRTLKICANHLVTRATTLQEHAGSEKSWVWHASDYSDGELKEELFCIRLGSVESAQKFKAVYEEAQAKSSGQVEQSAENVDVAAKALGSLSVEEKSVEVGTDPPA